jgi:hypothetical protein
MQTGQHKRFVETCPHDRNLSGFSSSDVATGE